MTCLVLVADFLKSKLGRAKQNSVINAKYKVKGQKISALYHWEEINNLQANLCVITHRSYNKVTRKPDFTTT